MVAAGPGEIGSVSRRQVQTQAGADPSRRRPKMAPTPTPRPNRQPTLGKLRPPRLGRVFGRDRLFAQLDASAAVPGVWVAGPPGIGKTTLVATYVEARAMPCAWLQLDGGDADPATFVHFLRAAGALIPQRRHQRPPLPSADDLRDVPAFIRRCFRRLALGLELPWVLVLDNVQELGNAALLHAGIAAALTELPERARVIAISQEPWAPSIHAHSPASSWRSSMSRH